MRQLAIAAAWHHDSSLRTVARPPRKIMTGETDHIVAELAARIFTDLADPQTINRLDNRAWKVPLWLALSDAGLPLAWVPEELGDAEASLADGFSTLRVGGRVSVGGPSSE